MMFRLALLAQPLLAAAAESSLRGLFQSHFITNAEATRSFAWTATTRTAEEALEITFPKGAGWADACFSEIGCRAGLGKVMTRARVGRWVEKDLLSGPDPFTERGGVVPVPWPHEEGLGDQLGHRQYVGYSRRQVCFIAAKALLGAGTSGYDNGLSRILNTSVPHCSSPAPSVRPKHEVEPSALTGEFGVTLWNLLAACAADPSLAQGGHGPMLLVAKGSTPAEVADVRKLAKETPLEDARLSACRYDDGDAGPIDADGFQVMPVELCTPPTRGAPGKDFMTGGPSRAWGQAIQDISAKFLGGYVFGNACGLGGGQDERLMTYFPEVFTLTFFLSQDADHPQLREPAWILGARMLMIGLDGSARFDRRLELDSDVPMVRDWRTVHVDGHRYAISRSTPFLAFMSENQDFLNESAYWDGGRSFADMNEDLVLARRNRHPLQRKVSADVWFSFQYQVRAWYSAVALSSYSEAVQPVLQAVVSSVGTGPFLAGLWWGDSQLGFLTVWIAQAIAARSWGNKGLPVQYYMYADFTENPGNQCFVHSQESCKACLARCEADPLPSYSYWMPDYAFMGPGVNKSCVVDSEVFCGQRGLEDVVAAYKHANASLLWEQVESALLADPNAEHAVFDLLLPLNHTGP
mmetsp:Transcript_45506/g.114608  ORF Transcript_45506/g.114608 Transcript_45506/m.114608 type:complete len:636 (+) Transcript_45506:74-1981(+)